MSAAPFYLGSVCIFCLRPLLCRYTCLSLCIGSDSQCHTTILQERNGFYVMKPRTFVQYCKMQSVQRCYPTSMQIMISGDIWKTMIDESYWFGFSLLAPERLWCLFELAAFLKSKDIGPDVSWSQGFKGVTVVTWKCGLVWMVHWPCFLFCSFSTIGRHLIELLNL